MVLPEMKIQETKSDFLLRIPLLPPIPTILTSFDLVTLEPSIAVTYVEAGHLLRIYGIGVAITASSTHHDQ